jgi:hypothetical protein
MRHIINKHPLLVVKIMASVEASVEASGVEPLTGPKLLQLGKLQ